MRIKLAVLALCLFVSQLAIAQAAPTEITNSDVINMTKAGIGEQTIVLAIQHGPVKFDTSPQALIALKGAGVSDHVLNAILAAANTKGQTNPEAQSASAGQLHKKAIKDPAEYSAYMAATGAQDPNQRISHLESFLITYPNSVMKPDALELLLKSYQQTANTAKMLETGQKLLQLDSNNLTALAFVSYIELTQAQQGGPDAQQKVADAGQLAVRGLKVLETMPKPDGVAGDVWTKTKETFRYTIFDWSAAMAAVQAKDYPAAANYLKDRVSKMPNDLGTVYYLGQSYLEQRPPVVDGLFWIARAVALAPNNIEIAKYGRSRYVGYRGSDQGWEELIADAKNETTIPAGFSVTPVRSTPSQGLTLKIMQEQSVPYTQESGGGISTSCSIVGTTNTSASANTVGNTTYGNAITNSNQHMSCNSYDTTMRWPHVLNVMFAQASDGNSYIIACDRAWRWSKCVPLRAGDVFNARFTSKGIEVDAVNSKGKAESLIYHIVQSTSSR